jgi:hypothetical protein
MRKVATAVSLCALLVAAASSCSTGTREFVTPPDAAPEDAGVPAPDAPTFGGNVAPPVEVTFTGTVYAPNGNLPLSNALVYFTTTAPDPIPAGAYCDECVKLPEGTFALSAADGTFEIAAQTPTGKYFLVVQKGQFRRVRKIEIEKGGTFKTDRDDTTLPGRSNVAKGDDVPRMVVLKDDADYDQIDESLRKLGITEFEIKTDRSLLENQTQLMKYHVVFVPCGTQDDPLSAAAQSKQNLVKFVEAGGKLYVTDWSYEFVRQPFTGFVSWEGETPTLGSATGGLWDAPAKAVDPGLADWLAATGDATFSVEGNWTTITRVSSRPGKDPKGQAVDIAPKVWVTATKEDGTVHPTTVSFEDQCGRVLFSTYHTESGSGGGLLAQEKALLYVLLEVGVCVGGKPGTK